MFSLYTAQQTKELLGSKGEFAVLDVREQEEFARGHMILASCTPLSRLECMVEDLVPCKRTPIVIVDSGVETDLPCAVRAASVLTRLGYSRLIVLEDGMQAWRKAGYLDFAGVGVLGKGFGAYMEKELDIQYVKAEEVKKLIESDCPSVLVDVRPREYCDCMDIAVSANVTGCEVAYRFADLVPDPKATVIMNCPGRVCGVINTQALRNAGITNKIVAFQDSEMKLPLTGELAAPSENDYTALPSPKALSIARKRAEKVAKKYGVAFADADQVLQWKKEADHKTLYLFDVRQPEEFIAGHIYGSRNVPGWKLMCVTEKYAAVRNARFVLIDDTEVRAVMAAHWLKQMGLPQVYVLKHGLGGSGFGGRGLAYGPVSPKVSKQPRVACVNASELQTMLGCVKPPLLLDVGSNTEHRRAHIPGSLWVARWRLDCAKEFYPDVCDIIIISDSDTHAAFAVADAEKLWPGARVRMLTGGTPGWLALNLPVAKGMSMALWAEDSSWYASDSEVNTDPAAKQYCPELDNGIIERINNDGAVRFDLVR